MTAAALQERPAQTQVGSATILPGQLPLSFELDAEHEAHEPPEARGNPRDGVRLMVSTGLDEPIDTVFSALPSVLAPGDLLVVNDSATLPAAIDAVLSDGRRVVIHVSTELHGGLWMVEPRFPIAGGSTQPLRLPDRAATAVMSGGVELDLLHPAPSSQRLWLAAAPDGTDLSAALAASGRPIRYPYVHRDWPIAAYQTVFAVEAGSAEMPSAARPFTPTTVVELVRRGVVIAPITLHTGVSSLEGHELPYAERYRVPPATAALVNATHAGGGRVIAVGTTVVRALETATDPVGTTHPAGGWTETVITPSTGVRAVDGLLTGWHEPRATHLAMLEAIAGREALILAYEAAFASGYRWHEFGDSHLLLPAIDRSYAAPR